MGKSLFDFKVFFFLLHLSVHPFHVQLLTDVCWNILASFLTWVLLKNIFPLSYSYQVLCSLTGSSDSSQKPCFIAFISFLFWKYLIFSILRNLERSLGVHPWVWGEKEEALWSSCSKPTESRAVFNFLGLLCLSHDIHKVGYIESNQRTV